MDDTVLSVSQFVALLNQTLEFAYPAVTIEGEISDYRGPNRNGHHYFTGLSVFSDEIQENALKSFPALYTRETDYVRLNIQDGRLDVSDLLQTPFGTDDSHFNQ